MKGNEGESTAILFKQIAYYNSLDTLWREGECPRASCQVKPTKIHPHFGG